MQISPNFHADSIHRLSCLFWKNVAYKQKRIACQDNTWLGLPLSHFAVVKEFIPRLVVLLSLASTGFINVQYSIIPDWGPLACCGKVYFGAWMLRLLPSTPPVSPRPADPNSQNPRAKGYNRHGPDVSSGLRDRVTDLTIVMGCTMRTSILSLNMPR
jgi:hypothetical protein